MKRAGRQQCGADAERHYDQVGFGVVSRLKRLIPVIKHLRHRRAHADGEDKDDGESANRTRHGLIIDAFQTLTTCDIIDIMGQLIVRNVADALIRALKVRAARKRRSAEAEHREILREALTARRKGGTLKDALMRMPDVGDDADFERPRDLGRKPAF